MIKLYKLDNGDKKKLKENLLKVSSKWAPYRTYACLHLWKWKDNEPLKAKPKKKNATRKS
jgi:DNA-3-methyladenine glycosylase II